MCDGVEPDDLCNLRHVHVLVSDPPDERSPVGPRYRWVVLYGIDSDGRLLWADAPEVDS